MSGGFGRGHHLHLIDGSAYVFRAFHALPPLTRKSDGLPIGAVAGFCNMLHRYVASGADGDGPTHAAVVFDSSSVTFRNRIYPEYKANRPPPPEDLVPQFPLTREATRAFNIFCTEMDGFEADDIIATLARQARDAGGRVTILSSDKDLMQLVGGGVEMLDAMRNKRIDREGVLAKFGVAPERVVDVQALAGDSTDNVPGAPGIGVKTAAQLIDAYGDLDTLLARAADIQQKKRRDILLTHADQIRMSRELVRLDQHVALDFGLDDLAVAAPQARQLLDFLVRMEFRTLTQRVSEHFGVPIPQPADAPLPARSGEEGHPPIDYRHYACVTHMAALEEWMARARDAGRVAVDTETTSLNEMTARLVGISLAVDAGEACYIPVGHCHPAHHEGELILGDVGDQPVAGQIPKAAAIAALKPLLEDPAVLKIGHNVKYDAKVLARHNIHLAPIDDTMLMSYALHAGLHGHGLDVLSGRFLEHRPISISSLLGSGKTAITFEHVPLEDATRYAAEDADVTLRLWQTFKPALHRARVTRVYERLERPLVPVLAEMEMAGVLVDRDKLVEMSAEFAVRLQELEEKIHESAGETFNVGSPKQLGTILFDRLQLRSGGRKTRSGAQTTGAQVLADLASQHELPGLVLDWRQLAKLKSTYTDSLQTHINPETGRVHTSYLSSGAVTGRLSSNDPNLQNIPIRNELGRRIREAFVAPEGYLLVSLDYSQIELRILADFAAVAELKRAFADGHDIHAATAAEMFNIPLDQMTAEMRRRAKAINFGVVYGISAFGLARNLRIPRTEAQTFLDDYFKRFPEIRTYMDEVRDYALEHKHVKTMFGRIIHLPEAGSKGASASATWRAAINAPIQGTAADIIRRAMLRMPAAIAGIDARMLLQVHDELLFEVHEDAVDELIGCARQVMEEATYPVVELDVGLVVDAGQGKNWSEAH